MPLLAIVRNLSYTRERKHVLHTSITDAHGFAEESRLRGRKSGALMSEMVNHFAHEYKSIHADISPCRTPLNCRAWIETKKSKGAGKKNRTIKAVEK